MANAAAANQHKVSTSRQNCISQHLLRDALCIGGRRRVLGHNETIRLFRKWIFLHRYFIHGVWDLDAVWAKVWMESSGVSSGGRFRVPGRPKDLHVETMRDSRKRLLMG